MIGNFNGALRRVSEKSRPEKILSVLIRLGCVSPEEEQGEFHAAWVAFCDPEVGQERRKAIAERMMALLREKASEEELGDETSIDRIVGDGGYQSPSSVEAEIKRLDPLAGEPKELMRRAVAVGAVGGILIDALWRAVEAPDSNQMQVSDLDWFAVAAIAIAEEIERGWNGTCQADYDRLTLLVSDPPVRTALVARLRAGEYSDSEHFRPWLGSENTDPRAEKLALVFTGELEEATKPLPPKEVSWGEVANIANALTNQLEYVLEANPLNAHIAADSIGGREVEMEEGRRGIRVKGWMGYAEDDVRQLKFRSASSGNEIQAKKLSVGRWELTFIPSAENPKYRGWYFELYDHPELVKALAPHEA